MVDLQCTEAGRDLCRDIQISDSEEYHVGECVECVESAGPILDNLNDAVEALGDGIGESRSDEGEYAIVVLSQGVDELAHGFQPASKGRCHPVFNEAFGSPRSLVLPELLEFILELPRSVDAAIGLVERPQRLRVFAGASRRMTIQ